MRASNFAARRWLTGAGAVALLANFGGAAHAQTAAAQDQVDASRAETQPTVDEAPAEQGVREMVVTAERRSQNLQDVPISATVLDAEDITRRGVSSVADLQQVSPSIAINTYNRSTFINIRGVGIAQSAPTSSPGVAYYIDGQFLPNEQYVGFSFFDIGTIEVLRGPQGTLTGQNSTGGAIYIRTPEPRFDAFSGYVDITAGDYGWIRSMAAANVPFSDTLALRVAMVQDLRDSYYQQVGTSRSTPGNVDNFALRANLLYQPVESVRFNLRWEHFTDHTDNNPVINRNLLPLLGPYRIQEDAVSFFVREGHRVSGEARIDVTDTIQVRGFVGYQDAFLYDQTDGDRTSTALPVPANLPTSAANTRTFPGRVSRTYNEHRIFTAEANILSTGNGPFQWVLGAFMLDGDIPLEQTRDNRNTVDFVQSNNTTVADAQNRSRAVFGQVSYRFIPQFELIVGARYSEDRQDYTRTGATDRQESDQWTGRVAANWYVTDDITIYASGSRGYKAGGVNLPLAVAPYGPETNTVFEGGLKSTLLDRRLRLNASIFTSDYQDVQFSSLFNGLPIQQNAASARSYGGELEITGQFGGLGFNAGVGYLDSTFTDGVCLNNTLNPAGNRTLCPLGTTPTTADDFVPEGSTLPFAPEWTINAGVQYEIELGGDSTLTPRFQYAHLSEQLATPFVNAQTIVPARDVVDFRLEYRPDRRWRIEAFATNLFDEVYIASQVQDSSSASGGIILGAPRQVGVRVTVQLGDM